MGSGRGSDSSTGAVLQVGAALVSSLELEEALSNVVESIGRALDVSSVSLWRYSHPRRLAVFEAFWNRDGAPPYDGDHVGMAVAFDARPDVAALIERREIVERHLDGGDLPAKARADMEKRGFRSTLEAPLVVGDEVLGSLSMAETRADRRFTTEERELFAQLCQLAAIAIRNAELYRREEEQKRRALSLLESSRATAVSLSAQQAVESIKSEIVSLLAGADVRVDVHLDRGDGQYVRFVSEADDGAEGAARSEPPDGLAERALGAAQPVQGRTDAGQTRLIVPLMLKDGVSGYVDLVGGLPRRFSDDEIDFVQTMANHAAVAVERARLQRTVARQSGIDVATGLYNRSYFHERVFAEVARAYRYRESVSLIMLSVDNVADYKDEYDQPIEGEVMRAVGRFLKRNLRRRIDVACRWADDGFAILLPNTGLRGGGTAKAADRLRKTIEVYKFKTQDDDPIGMITVTMGVACYPEHADDATDLPEAAEEALRRAQEAGPNQVALARS